jgi:hypothetical protein
MANSIQGSTDAVRPCARRQAIMLGRQSDERKAIRALLTAPAVIISEGNRHLGLVRDLSLGGMFIYTDFEPSCAADIQLTIRLTKDGSATLMCRGTVVRVVRGAAGSAYGVAVQANQYELCRV